LRIGIVPCLNSSLGGVYQYSVTMLDALNDWTDGKCPDDLVLFVSELQHSELARRRVPTGSVMTLQPPGRQRVDTLRRIVGEGPHREAWRWVRGRLSRRRRDYPDPDRILFRHDVNEVFRDARVDFVVYPYPNRLSFEAGIPYVMSIHDLQHRLQPEFPEVSNNGEREWREYYFRNGSRYATLLLADSEVGKEDILNLYGSYGVTADRIKVLPYLPASYLAVDVSERERQRVREVYRLPGRYIFYPAQFWPHKNHINIVRAVGLLKRQYQLTIPMVFAGWHSGDIREQVFRDVMDLAARLGLQDHLQYLGYVADEDMSALYAAAAALVMPTFFGPTNIPVLEAWAYGCPVLTSAIRGIREQVQDAAMLVDPRSSEAIADGIYQLWTDERLRADLSERGRRRLAAYTPEDYRRTLRQILAEAKARVSSEPCRIPAR
jgi:glycosyltransferase involved in cell wall biosynthesis